MRHLRAERNAVAGLQLISLEADLQAQPARQV